MAVTKTCNEHKQPQTTTNDHKLPEDDHTNGHPGTSN